MVPSHWGWLGVNSPRFSSPPVRTQLQTDECVLTRYVSNIIGQTLLNNEDLLVNGKFLNMEIVPMQMRVYRSCSHP